MHVDERYKFPRGMYATEFRKRWFDARQFTENQLNRNVYPYECVEGWYVMDAVIIDLQVSVTFGRV